MNTYPVELKKEIANSITHGIGLILAIVASPILVAISVKQGFSATIGVVIFAVSLIMVYASSTAYHSIAHPPVKRVLRIIDHICIYFLIAGTYTPFILNYSFNTQGIMVLVALWLSTLFGIFFKIYYTGKYEALSVALYLLMGWSVVFLPGSWLAACPYFTKALLITGGVLYTTGVFFYLSDKYTYNHTIWHLFVLGASTSHFLAILFSMLNI